MVNVVEKNNQTLFQCEECGLFYAEEEIAKKCESWCAANKSCNIEIVKNAVEIDK